MTENVIKLSSFEGNKYRLKRFSSNRDPVEEISETIKGLHEEIQKKNKRIINVDNCEFKCDLFRIEDIFKEKKIIVNLINPQINIKLSINNQPPIVNNVFGIISDQKIKEEEISNQIKNSSNLINKKEIIYSSFPLLNNLNLPDYLSKKQDKKPEIISTDILSLNNINSLINIPKNREKSSEIKEPLKENNVAISIPNLVQIKNNPVSDNIKSIYNEIQINQPHASNIQFQNTSKEIPIKIISNLCQKICFKVS